MNITQQPQPEDTSLKHYEKEDELLWLSNNKECKYQNDF